MSVHRGFIRFGDEEPYTKMVQVFGTDIPVFLRVESDVYVFMPWLDHLMGYFESAADMWLEQGMQDVICISVEEASHYCQCLDLMGVDFGVVGDLITNNLN